MADRHRQPEIDTERLRLARLDLGLTLREVSDRCRQLGVTVGHSNLSAYERGVVCPNPRRLLVLARALHLKPSDLLTRPARP